MVVTTLLTSRLTGPDGPSRTPSGPASRPALVALLAIIGLVLVSIALGRPPDPVPVSAPSTEFSAERAMHHLRATIPDRPTPIGSTASDEVRDYLSGQLAALGLQVEVQSGVGAFTNFDQTAAGRVHNVVATLPGTDPTGRVILSAHYDTTFGSPGAADDKAAVAAILETLRAVTDGEPLRNDIVVLLTDGEEPGMLGADAFVQANPAGDTDVVLNFEATGNAGSSVLFETSAGNADLIDRFARWVPHPAGDSAMAALYESSGQHTDFTVLKAAGFRGLNFALVDGTAFYHHSQDTVDNLDPASLQHHGGTMLALTHGFGTVDLTSLTSQGERTFFTLFGTVVSYSQSLVRPLAGLAAVLVLALAISVRRRGAATGAQLVGGVGAALVPVVATTAATLGGWQLLVRLRPGYGAMFMGDPFRPELYRAALVALVLAVVSASYLLLRRSIGAAAMHVGGLFWLSVLALATAALEPEVSFYGAIPAALAAATALVAPLAPRAWGQLAWVVGLTPACALLVSGGSTLLGVLGLSTAPFPTVFLVAATWLVLPVADAAWRPHGWRRSALVPVALTAVAGTLVAAGLAIDRFDQTHPEPAHLSYVEQAGQEVGSWFSTDARPHPWTARHTPDLAGDGVLPPLPYGTNARWVGDTTAMALPAPEVSVLAARPGAQAFAELRIRSTRDADAIVLHVDRQVTEVTVRAERHPTVTARPTLTPPASRQSWPYELRFYDPPPEGIRVRVHLPGPDLPTVFVSDYTIGLAAVPGLVPRPPHLGRSSAHSAELVVVGQQHQLESRPRQE